MMLLDLVRQARRRLICNDVLSQTANASSAALFALILLLLLGTQILDWQWLLLIPAAAVLYGAFRIWRSLPAAYPVAQILDRRLDLKDTLSTALFFEDPSRRGSVPESVRECQHEQARRLCPQVDVRSAVPFHMPRTAYASVALLMVASSLFALRYGLSRSLDLKPPLARIIHRSLGGSDPVERATAQNKKDGPRVPDLDQTGMALGDRDTERLDAATNNALENSAIPDLDNSAAKQSRAEPGEEGDQIASGEPGDESEDGVPGENPGEGQKGGAQAKEGKEGGGQQANNEKNSLLDKFKDAMQNMLSKMKIPPPQGGQQKSSQMAQNKQGKAQSQGGKQSDGKGQKKMDGSREDGAQEGEASESQGEQSTDAKGQGQNGEQQANKQPGSGIGKQDGDKDVRLAEQMAAMGKLSEIIGKRSANVSGEAMVEVKNTSQALTTRYESRRAAHGDAGGEINRDEIPVALQGYVEKYFEQVRQGKK